MPSSKSVKFHAGKVQYDDETNRCTPLPHKGVISIKPSVDEPDFLDFTWSAKSDSTQSSVGTIEKDEFLLIPGDVTIKKIQSCNTGRVIALTFLSSGAKYLYWLQDVGDIDQLDKWTDKDDKIIRDISELVYVNDEDEEEEEEEAETPNEEVEVKDEGSEQQPVATAATAATSAKPDLKLPISSISSVLDLETIDKHLAGLNTKQLKELYGQFLPQSVAEDPTKEQMLDVIRSGFFQQSEQRLCQYLTQGNGAGYLLAQSLKFDYHGEGIDGFLTGIRELAKKEKSDEKAEEEDTEMKD